MKQALYAAMDGMPVINTHSHHAPAAEQRDLTLENLLEQSYVGWCEEPPAPDRESRAAYVRRLRANTYFVWFERALRALTGVDQPLCADSWDAFAQAARGLFADPEAHLTILKDRCHYEHTLLDAYWNPGSDEGLPGFNTPVYRINMFCFGYDAQTRDHNRNNPFATYGWRVPPNFTAYLAMVDEAVRAHVAGGCVALKNALAYDRGLDFEPCTFEQAKQAYFNPRADAVDKKRFEDFVFAHLCDLAAELSVPVLCHTGLGGMDKTNAMQMEKVIRAHPRTQFGLMHGSYPWTQDVLGLVHAHSNVYADLCWLPIISTSAAERFLRELIEVGAMDRITWGCDTWNSVESYGALLAGRKVLAEVFAGCIEDGLMDQAYALDYIRAILHDNAARIYRL